MTVEVRVKTREEEFVREVLSRNPYLNGFVDIADGDLFAGLERKESFQEPEYVDSLEELYEKARGYQGAFVYRNLYLFSDQAYGCFVYVSDNPENYVEHLNLSSMSFNEFRKTIEKYLKNN